MKVQYCSDLHLEFSKNRIWLKENPLLPTGDILVIAGDTYHLDKDLSKLAFIKKVANQFERVYLIPGNHEYYGGFNAALAAEILYEKIMSNVVLINNCKENFGGVKFIFSTMWSLITQNFLVIKRRLYDFEKIKFNGNTLTINQFNDIHQQCFTFIAEAVKEAGSKVVVTHHLPSDLCNAREFEKSPINQGFCVDKTSFIKNSDILYWIYGHSHRNKAPIQIGNTTLLTNQLGYVGYTEHQSFKRDKIFEIPDETIIN